MLTCQITLTGWIEEGNSLAQVLGRFHVLEDSGQERCALAYAATGRQGR